MKRSRWKLPFRSVRHDLVRLSISRHPGPILTRRDAVGRSKLAIEVGQIGEADLLSDRGYWRTAQREQTTRELEAIPLHHLAKGGTRSPSEVLREGRLRHSRKLGCGREAH